ncbi:hypothetical protein HYW18_02030 [Candidatus Uhrbacteria bacterium]|nr:hypothetical protein [Candidatus Uhrbacteria bacterium]
MPHQKDEASLKALIIVVGIALVATSVWFVVATDLRFEDIGPAASREPTPPPEAVVEPVPVDVNTPEWDSPLEGLHVVSLRPGYEGETAFVAIKLESEGSSIVTVGACPDDPNPQVVVDQSAVGGEPPEQDGNVRRVDGLTGKTLPPRAMCATSYLVQIANQQVAVDKPFFQVIVPVEELRQGLKITAPAKITKVTHDKILFPRIEKFSTRTEYTLEGEATHVVRDVPKDPEEAVPVTFTYTAKVTELPDSERQQVP